MKKVSINGNDLSIKDIVDVARNNVEVEIPKKVKTEIRKCRKFLDELIKKKKVVYGVTTGFGALGNIIVQTKNIKELQTNLIRSHSAGVGSPLDKLAFLISLSFALLK